MFPCAQVQDGGNGRWRGEILLYAANQYSVGGLTVASRAGLIFKQNLSFNSEAQKLFSKREWQNAMKASLIDAGRDWIAGALPKRFSDFAVSQAEPA